MVFLLPVLILGLVAYFTWRHFTSSLTRDCRWRLDRAAGVWRCAACGGELAERGPDSGDGPPRICTKHRG